MHGLINNWEWYDYIQVEICIHGFNNLFFFAEREWTCTQHARIQKISPKGVQGTRRVGGRGSALDICSLIHELNIQQIIIIEYSEGPPK